jgi:hypothetical protein
MLTRLSRDARVGKEVELESILYDLTFNNIVRMVLAMAKLNPKFISLILFALVVIVSAEVIFEEKFEGIYISLSISYLDS